MVFLGMIIARAEFDQSIEIWYPDDDPEIVRFHYFSDLFGNEDSILITVFADDVLQPNILRAVDRLTRGAASQPHVVDVRSLTNIKVPNGDGDTLSSKELIPEIPRTTAENRVLREKILASPLLRGNLLSNSPGDASHTRIHVELGKGVEGQIVTRGELVDSLKKLASEEVKRTPGTDIRVVGLPVFDSAAYHHAQRDNSWIIPCTFALVILVGLVVLGAGRSALLPAVIVGVTAIWVIGTMSMLGWKINIITTILIPLVIAVGVLDSLHLLVHYPREFEKVHVAEPAIIETLVQLARPCFWTTFTTVVGMLSLSTNGLQPIREMGVLAALGVTYALILTFTLLPILLKRAGDPVVVSATKREGGLMFRCLVLLSKPSRRSSVLVLLLAGVALLAAGWSSQNLLVGANPRDYFPPSNPVRIDYEKVEAESGGVVGLELLVSAPGNGFWDPSVLARVEDFQDWLERQPEVSSTLSAVDLQKEFNRVLNDGDDRFFLLPTTSEAIAQIFLVMEMGDREGLDRLVQGIGNDEYSEGRVTAWISIPGRNGIEFIDRVEAEAEKRFGDPELRIEVTGIAKLLATMGQYLVASQVRSLSLAFLVVTCVMFVIFRSARFGLLAMIPNLLPISLILGIMAATETGLEEGTVMIGCIAIGINVDDTIHFLTRYREFLVRGFSVEAAIEQTMLNTGRAIIATSTILMAAFVIQIGSGFQPIINFGWISTLEIGLALVADLVVLPAALVLLRPDL